MAAFIEKYFKVLVILLLLVLCLLLYASRNNGRYAVCSADSGTVYVLDTKTSKLWARTVVGVNFYLGTNKHPESDIINEDKKNAGRDIESDKIKTPNSPIVSGKKRTLEDLMINGLPEESKD